MRLELHSAPAGATEEFGRELSFYIFNFVKKNVDLQPVHFTFLHFIFLQFQHGQAITL